MSAKHTPGPWESFGSSTIYIEGRLENGWLQEVCSVGPTGADNGYGEQQQANARLIAAAPELLEALEAVVSQLEGHDLHNGDVSAINTAYAAIAKATGEQE